MYSGRSDPLSLAMFSPGLERRTRRWIFPPVSRRCKPRKGVVPRVFLRILADHYWCLCQQRPDNLTMHVSQTETTSLEFEGESLVIDPEQVEHRGLQIMDAHGIFGNVVGKVV